MDKMLLVVIVVSQSTSSRKKLGCKHPTIYLTTRLFSKRKGQNSEDYENSQSVKKKDDKIGEQGKNKIEKANVAYSTTTTTARILECREIGKIVQKRSESTLNLLLWDTRSELYPVSFFWHYYYCQSVLLNFLRLLGTAVQRARFGLDICYQQCWLVMVAVCSEFHFNSVRNQFIT